MVVRLMSDAVRKTFNATKNRRWSRKAGLDRHLQQGGS